MSKFSNRKHSTISSPLQRSVQVGLFPFSKMPATWVDFNFGNIYSDAARCFEAHCILKYQEFNPKHKSHSCFMYVLNMFLEGHFMQYFKDTSW